MRQGGQPRPEVDKSPHPDWAVTVATWLKDHRPDSKIVMSILTRPARGVNKMKQDTEFFKKRRRYIKKIKDRRRAYAKLVGDIQHDLEVEFRDLRRSVALQLAIEHNPDADPVVAAGCDEYYRRLTEIIGPKNESKPRQLTTD